MLTPFRRWTLRPLAVLLLLPVVRTAPASAQLAVERLAGFPTPVEEGTGRVRLAGMGGFETAVPDENNEINLLDYTGNPAGFSEDRDSWTIDLRYSHSEFEEGRTSPVSTDVKVNDGTFILGYHLPHRFGLGGTLDYSEAKTLDMFSTSNTFNIVGLELISNYYLLKQLSLGVRGGYTGEQQEISTTQFYTIEHDAHQPHVGGGLAFEAARGVTLGFRADAFPTTIDGTSASSTHQDTFTWDRPGSDWAGHVFVNRGRLDLGIDYDRLKVEGKESVRLSWSERFLYNPTPDDYIKDADTFSEDRSTKTFRTRGALNVIPGRLNLSAAYGKSDGDFKVITNTNILGSLEKSDATTSTSEFLGGGSYTLMDDRLMVAGEVKVRSADFDNTGANSRRTVNEDDLVLRLGGEFLVGEKVAARAGIVRGKQDLTTTQYDMNGIATQPPEQNGSFKSWRLATGLGIIPWGAIWQLDLAYDITLHSDQEEDLSHFAAYIRYLF
jgi:hypothetical protein